MSEGDYNHYITTTWNDNMTYLIITLAIEAILVARYHFTH